jgi:hypothetical protein
MPVRRVLWFNQELSPESGAWNIKKTQTDHNHLRLNPKSSYLWRKIWKILHPKDFNLNYLA